MVVKSEINILTRIENIKEKYGSVEGNCDCDYVEETIGAAGLWQVGISSTAALTRYIAIGNMTSIVFLTPTTDFICTDLNDNGSMKAENNTCYENCRKYDFRSEVMETSLISDFQLICGKAWLGSFTQSVLMLGFVLGASFFGWLSDRFGRRKAIISSSVLNIVSMIPTSFAPDYWTFTVLRFIVGFASGGSFIVCVPIIMEIIGKRYREVAGALCVLPDGIGEALLAPFAYFLPKWNTYLLGFSMSCIFILFLICFLPESPRWLISNGKVDQAIEEMTRAAKFNRLPTTDIREIVMRSVEAMKIKENEKTTENYLDFFRTKRLCILTVSTLFTWIVVGTCYYGIYQYMTLLGFDVFVTVAILGLIQVPLCPVEIAINKMFSRKISIYGTLLVTGFTMVILIFTPNGHWATTLFGVIGFSASSITFVVLYVYTAELYPTPLRSMAYGMTSAAAKMGAMVAPFIANIRPVWIPSSVFAVLSLTAVLTCFILPETKGRNLKDVVD
ncbi:organic cation transporter protein-like [Vanessa cardui]|uniref:organic cation transporter protein-like n=1 Tax=Vanessa cardui TaxID=171605 RepID=UPI001F1348D5|nr:organic cation transporter protein-like [Vanessa cardui]